MKRLIPSIAAGCLLLGLSTFEFLHFFQRQPWPGFVLGVNYISWFYITFWLATCASLVRFRYSRLLALPWIASVLALLHGAVIRLGEGWQGYVNIAAGAALLAINLYVAIHWNSASSIQAERESQLAA